MSDRSDDGSITVDLHAIPRDLITGESNFLTSISKWTLAGEHLKALDGYIRAYQQHGPWTAVQNVHAAGQVRLYRLKLIKVPMMLATAAGDVLGCLHEALDHLAWEMGPGDEISNPNITTQFPISVQDPAKDPARAANWTRMTFGMTDAAVEFLDSFQPYHERNGGNGGQISQTRRLLGALSVLSNRDKHRRITPLKPVAKVFVRTNTGEFQELPCSRAFEDGDILPINRLNNIPDGDPQFKTPTLFHIHETAFPRSFPFQLEPELRRFLYDIGQAVKHVTDAANAVRSEIAHPNGHWRSLGWP